MNALAYSKRGNAKIELQDYNGAIEDFNKAIELNPEDSLTYCIRGSARSELRDYIGALKDIKHWY